LINCHIASRRIKASLDVDTEFQKGRHPVRELTGVGAVSAFWRGVDVSTHPAIPSSAPLYLQNQIREITTA